MPKLLRPQQLIDELRRTDLVPLTSLRDLVASWRGRAVQTQDLLESLVAEQLLTPFQAEELVAGRCSSLQLNSFRLIERLGSGGMGEVYLAVDRKRPGYFAVKILSAEWQDDPTARARLEREGMAAHGLMHPNIVRVYQFECDAHVEVPFIVMEYVDGVSLQAAVALTGTMSAEAVAHFGWQVASGLCHAWKTGLVHRDIKPANLLLSKSGLVKILDLGIVRIVEDGQQSHAGFTGKQILGTIDYLSPEQALDCSNVDCRADIYSLGATLYFLLAGHPPFHHGSQAHRLLQKQREDATPIHLLRPDVPVELSTIISRMLARRRENRYQTPAEVVQALEAFPPLAESDFAKFFERIHCAKEGRIPSPCAFDDDQSDGTEGSDTQSFSTELNVSSEIMPKLAVTAKIRKHDITTAKRSTGVFTTLVPQTAKPPTTGVDTHTPAPMRVPQALLHPANAARRILGVKWWVLALTLALLAAVAFGCYLLRAEPQSPVSNAKYRHGTLIVSNDPDDCPSIREALKNVQENQRIEIHAEEWRESVVLVGPIPGGVKLVGITKTGQPLNWSAPPSDKSESRILDVRASGALRLEHIEFDGDNVTKQLVKISNGQLACSQVTFTDYTQVGLEFDGQTPHDALDVISCRFKSYNANATALALGHELTTSTAVSIAHSRFEGQQQCGLRITSAIQRLDVEQCRFFQMPTAISYETKTWPAPHELILHRSVFADVQTALRLAVLPTHRESKFNLDGNVFDRCVHASFAAELPNPVPANWQERLESLRPGQSQRWKPTGQNATFNGHVLDGIPPFSLLPNSAGQLPRDRSDDRTFLRLDRRALLNQNPARLFGVLVPE